MTDQRLAERPELPDRLPLPVVDNHCHLDIQRDDSPAVAVEQIIAEAASVGVDRLVQIGCDIGSARWTVSLLDDHPALLGGVAIHPNEVPRHEAAGDLDEVFDEIASLARHPKIRVIGETGLDYFRTGPEGVAVQQESFRRHIALAKELGVALQIHDRDAHDDVLRILAEEGAPEKTVLHCYSGDMEMARECVRRGYFLSFAGTVTFRSAKDLRNALAVTPMEHLLVETDAPYLTPTPHRGRANAPYLIPHTVRAMAATLNTSVPQLCQALSDNSERVYGPWS
ncbi:TatD family hydrolase [Ornithinimicrobium tianjinense]|uniref:AraC family transcriptional regulator n=1 Tax=Ornithinimicrobium tianjinense TaxID=1195761 RepID=A0A917F385_9MICO|nr:TatD family hydrolase [Ornithinimicrobium tianjinense]GGF38766.1 AraC family transcriptional regulator [Ornithinimicrobium tianjinense]